MPNSVILLRGNHETRYCTQQYGFEKEVLTKYAEKGEYVYEECLKCFKKLPLASIIHKKVYTAHGGIFRAQPKKKRKLKNLSLGSLEELSNAERSVDDPPGKGSKSLIAADVLWSDPKMEPGLSRNVGRNVGLYWGPDCTEEFLHKFNLKLIIRSHEGPDARYKRPGFRGMDEGYTIDHVGLSGRLITVFSAPDYPQFQATEDRYRNKGAYITLGPPDFDIPVYHCFEAVTPRPKADAYYDFQEVPDSDQEINLLDGATGSGSDEEENSATRSSDEEPDMEDRAKEKLENRKRKRYTNTRKKRAIQDRPVK